MAISWLVGIGVLLAASAVEAADPALADHPTHPQIIGGEAAESCGWPSVVYVMMENGGACTGGLIHPQIVLTAAHCIPDDAALPILFGESGATATQLVETEYCRANPEFTSLADLQKGTDFAFCRLAEPVTNVPIIPIAMGCEEEIIAAGRPITHVGFGYDENGDAGPKRVVTVPIDTLTETGEFTTETPGMGPCNGDSGSPVFAQMPASDGGDDTWRVVGIFSWLYTSCVGATGNVIASNAVEFIESESGIDVTPCHTADGTWAPSGECQGVPIEPGVGGEGSYATMCETGALAGESASCGPPLSSSPDTTPPTVDFVSPPPGDRFEPTGGVATIAIEATADDGDGWGVARVDLVIAPVDADDATTVSTAYPPFHWNATFPVGGYFLRVIATDHADNVGESAWIGIGIGVDAPTDLPGDDGTSTGTSGSATTDTSDPDSTSTTSTTAGDSTDSTGTTASQADGDDGCGCAARHCDPTPWWMLALVMVAHARRRRSGE